MSSVTSSVRLAVRWRYAIVVAVFLLCALIGSQDNGDLEYFTQALHVLGTSGSAGGLHLYAVRPDIQIGPLAILGVGLLDLVCFGKIVFAVVAGALALLLVTTRVLERLAVREGVPAQRVGLAIAVGGSVLAAAFAVAVPGWGHIDDLAALTAIVAALYACRTDRAVLAGALLAVATGCKPWAGFAWAMLLLLPSGHRFRGLATFVVGSLLCWLPFVAGAPGALHALSAFSLKAIFGSLPLQLGYASAPSWIRPAQLALATAGVLLCVRRRRLDLVLLVVALSRLVLDAGVFPYYDVELVLGCLAVDVYAAGRGPRLVACAPLSLLSWIAITLIQDEAGTSAQAFVGRMALYVALLGVGVWRGGVWRWRAAPEDGSSFAQRAPELVAGLVD